MGTQKKGVKKEKIDTFKVIFAVVFVLSLGIAIAEQNSGFLNRITGGVIGVQKITGTGPYGLDFGDAPNSGTAAYTAQSSSFPTKKGSGGPCHNGSKAKYCVKLGPSISYEDDAKDPDRDENDNGLSGPSLQWLKNVDHCKDPVYFEFIVNFNPDPDCDASKIEHSNYIVDVWFDWNRDGKWEGEFNCSIGGVNIPTKERLDPETVAVRAGPQTVSFATFPYLLPGGPQKYWMRVSLHPEGTTMNPDGSMSGGSCFEYGETEDYLIEFSVDKDGDKSPVKKDGLPPPPPDDEDDEIPPFPPQPPLPPDPPPIPPGGGVPPPSGIIIWILVNPVPGYPVDEFVWVPQNPPTSPDCNDNDPTIYPGAREICDNVDNNCDCLIDKVPLECTDESLVSYWDLNDPFEAAQETITKSSTCLYDESGRRHEGIGHPVWLSFLHGIWQSDIQYWEELEASGLEPSIYSDKFDIDPEDNIYHVGGEICYTEHALEYSNAYYNNTVPPINVWGPLSDRTTQPDPTADSDKKHILYFGECVGVAEGYYAVGDSLTNYGHHAYEKDCSNTPYGRPQFTISYEATSIASNLIRDIMPAQNHGKLFAGIVGTENCSWPGDCWNWNCRYDEAACPPSTTPWQVYAYDPETVITSTAPEGGCSSDALIACSPCAPDCVTNGSTLPPQFTSGCNHFCNDGTINEDDSALAFNGDGDYMEVDNLTDVPAANESQTIAIRYRVNSNTFTSNPLGFRTLASVYNQSASSAIVIGINNQSLGVWTYDGTLLVNTSFSHPVDECVFVAYTYNSSSTYHYLYINGTEVDNSTVTPDDEVPSKLRLGKNWTTQVTSFNGTIDDIAIWNKTLSSSEIQSIRDEEAGYCGVRSVCNDATMILWDETDKRNLPFATGIGGIVGQQIKSFTNYTLIYKEE
jgi:hypothetical protein